MDDFTKYQVNRAARKVMDKIVPPIPGESEEDEKKRFEELVTAVATEAAPLFPLLFTDVTLGDRIKAFREELGESATLLETDMTVFMAEMEKWNKARLEAAGEKYIAWLCEKFDFTREEVTMFLMVLKNGEEF